MESHSFSVQIAFQIGLKEAIVLGNIIFMFKIAQGNEQKFFQDRYWTYMSVRAFQDTYPYLSKRMIEGALNRLEEKGLLLVDEFNKRKYDRTKWYSPTNRALELYSLPFHKKGNGTHETGNAFHKKGNVISQKGKPIPVITNITIDSNTTGFDQFWNDYDYKKGKRSAKKAFDKLTNGERIELSEKLPQWLVAKSKEELTAGNNPKRYWPHPATFLSQRRWQDEELEIETKPVKRLYPVYQPKSHTA